MLAEESFLLEQYGSAYEDYCRRVNRWLPSFGPYAPPKRPFNFKKVIFKENDSCFNLLLTALLVLAWKDSFFSGRVRQPLIIPGAALLLTLIYILIKILKKKSAAKAAA